MRLNENKFFLILTTVMLCGMLGILIFGGFYAIAASAFEDTIIEVIAQKIFLFDLTVSVVLFFIFLFSAFLNADKQAEHIADLNEATDEFKNLYNKLKEDGLDLYERERKKLRYRKTIENILKYCFVICMFIFTFFNFSYVVSRYIVVPLFYLTFFSYLYIYKKNKEYITMFEEKNNEMIPNLIIKHMGYEKVRFIPINSEKESEYDELYAKLYPTPQDKKIYYKNFIEGYMYNDLEVKLTDMYLAKKTHSKSMMQNVFFSGYFGYIEFKRDLFNSFSITRKDTYNQKEIIRETNNEFFDKYFSLKSNNERFKAGLIRDGIADAVARFYSSTNIDLQIETRGEMVVFKIFSSSIFEPTFSRNYKERIYTQYYFLNELFVLIDEIYEIIKNNSY